uniref:F-box domain-containing protein n=1 Tax=Caenorhabditis tropicalis TaxID=1561998 RepID=A0A1I7U5H5_9PELO
MQPLLIDSNMSLVPYTFPLFNLPILAIQHVADFWNPFEIYNLSRISKRAKGIAKLVSKRPESILLDKQNVRIGYLNDHTYSNREIEWHIILSREQNPDDYKLENELYWLEEEAVINGPNGKLATIQIRKFMFHMKYAEEAWHPDYDNPVVRQMDDEECDELYLVVQ